MHCAHVCAFQHSDLQIVLCSFKFVLVQVFSLLSSSTSFQSENLSSKGRGAQTHTPSKNAGCIQRQRWWRRRRRRRQCEQYSMDVRRNGHELFCSASRCTHYIVIQSCSVCLCVCVCEMLSHILCAFIHIYFSRLYFISFTISTTHFFMNVIGRASSSLLFVLVCTEKVFANVILTISYLPSAKHATTVQFVVRGNRQCMRA